MDCLFCKIVAGEIPASRVETGDAALDEDVFAFEDIQPQAPHHVLIIPRRHFSTVNDLGDEDVEIAGKLIQAARKIARNLGVDESGYRLVMNCQEGAGQSVFHIHLHLMAGRPLRWPPG